MHSTDTILIDLRRMCLLPTCIGLAALPGLDLLHIKNIQRGLRLGAELGKYRADERLT